MAKYAFATSNTLTKKAWEEKLFRNTTAKPYFSRFMGESEDSAVQVKTDLTKEKGDTIYFGLVTDLDYKNYKTNGEVLEGNEQKLTDYNHSVVLEEYAIGVRDRGPLDRQRAMFSIDEVAKNRLTKAGADLIDYLCFTGIQASHTKTFYGGSATSTATLTASDKITPILISKVNTWASTGGNESQPIIRPIMVDGKPYRVMLVHDDVGFDLENDSTFYQARREAEVRGKENPIFTGAYMIWNGVVVHKHPRVDITTTWGASSNVNGAKCVLFGAQALCWAWGKRPKVVAEEFDYGREHGYGWTMMAKCNKPKFNSKDYGVVGVHVARTKISDA